MEVEKKEELEKDNPISFLCRTGIHSWGVWGEPSSSKTYSYMKFFQSRRCLKCNILGLRNKYYES